MTLRHPLKLGREDPQVSPGAQQQHESGSLPNDRTYKQTEDAPTQGNEPDRAGSRDKSCGQIAAGEDVESHFAPQQRRDRRRERHQQEARRKDRDPSSEPLFGVKGCRRIVELKKRGTEERRHEKRYCKRGSDVLLCQRRLLDQVIGPAELLRACRCDGCQCDDGGIDAKLLRLEQPRKNCRRNEKKNALP
jgi:hypothetical protein